MKLGYRTFADSREASDYLQDVLKKATPLRKLNEVRGSAATLLSRAAVLAARRGTSTGVGTSTQQLSAPEACCCCVMPYPLLLAAV